MMLKLNYKALFSWLPLCLLFAGFIILNAHQTLITYEVTMESIPLSMNFSGIVKPLNLVNVISPVDGTVSRITAKFGNTVRKGEVLFYIKSPQLETTLRTAITNFLKAKSSFGNMSYQHTGNNALFKAGLISKIEYLSAEDQFQSANLALWEARETLKKLLIGIGINEEEIEKLSLNDIKKIQDMIIQATGDLEIISPAEGVLSSQNKLGGEKSGGSNELSVGTSVKQGDIIAIIYEMAGLNFTVNINEIQFQDISIGQAAIITGVAYPSVTLNGYVKSINHEANSSGGQYYSTPTYTIRIIVPKITAKQRQLIQEGMSAEITIIKQRPPGIHVPLSTLIKTPNGYVVKRINPKNGSIEEVPVTTGSTDEGGVEVKSGLNEGDRIVISD